MGLWVSDKWAGLRGSNWTTASYRSAPSDVILVPMGEQGNHAGPSTAARRSPVASTDPKLLGGYPSCQDRRRAPALPRSCAPTCSGSRTACAGLTSGDPTTRAW